MPTLSVVYFSATGTTAMLVDAICAGAQELVSTRAYRVLGTDIVDGCFRNEDALVLVDRADAVVFGKATTMGGPAAQYKAFADASGTDGARVAEKTSYFTVLAAQNGMIWCNLDFPGRYDPAGRNRLGTQVGLVTCQVPPVHQPV